MPIISTSASGINEGTSAWDALRLSQFWSGTTCTRLREGSVWMADVVGTLKVKRWLDLPSVRKVTDGIAFETYWLVPPRACVESTAPESVEPLAPGLQLDIASLTRPRNPLVTTFCGLSIVALRAVPSFSFRFLSEGLVASGEDGSEPLGRAKSFS